MPGLGWLDCRDCLGKGHVDHCVACVRRPGLLWLGGDEYLECPACEGTGRPLRRRPHVLVNGLLRPPAPGPVVGAGRNVALER